MYISVDIDIDEILWNCGKHDKTELLTTLLEEISDDEIRTVLRKCKPNSTFTFGEGILSAVESEFQESLRKLSNAYIQVTSEECDIINSIAKRF